MRDHVGRAKPWPNSAADVVGADLDYVVASLPEELAAMAGRRILITGGAGFLGYYLVQSLLHWNDLVEPDRRVDVTVYDNYVRGVPAWLTSLAERPDLALVTQDMTRPLPDPMSRFDYVIHGASIASPTYYRRYPIETMDANVLGLRNLLDHAQETGVLGFLFMSSSEIYGDPTPENIPTPEDYRGNVSCTGPRACYDEAKRFGEALCVNFARARGVPVKVARPFNNYGPGLKITDRRVLPDFARDIMAGRDVVMLSDGSPTRTFCYSADAVIGYLKILVRGRPGEAYNIGVEGPEISILELAERMVATARDALGYGGRVVRRASSDADYLLDNPSRRCPDIAKARGELDFDPQVSLDDGLHRLLVWYTGNRDAEDA
jgi:UDP-glucuronate decarboxylase